MGREGQSLTDKQTIGHAHPKDPWSKQWLPSSVLSQWTANSIRNQGAPGRKHNPPGSQNLIQKNTASAAGPNSSDGTILGMADVPSGSLHP